MSQNKMTEKKVIEYVLLGGYVYDECEYSTGISGTGRECNGNTVWWEWYKKREIKNTESKENNAVWGDNVDDDIYV